MWSARRAAPVAVLAIVAAGCGSDGAPRHDGSRGQDSQPAGSTTPPTTSRSDAARLLTQGPYVGVSCRKANSIACDRVGLAVWLAQPAARVGATISGQRVRLHRPRARGGWWEGFLQPAGLLDGALRVTPDRGRYFWQGSHPRSAHVAVTITRASGTTDRTSVTVPLRPGWG
jgi:hypothetical protein